MLKLLAPVENIRFDLEDALDKQSYSIHPLPFNGMDKSAAAVCSKFIISACDKDNLCPYRHVRGDKSVVCKHWLRGLCKKGDECEFLHEYDMSKMPECYFFSKYNQCGNKECEFLHIDRESKIKDCPWYDRGFCRHGPNCKNRHLKKVICQNYLFGFCPDGPTCKFKHPKFELPVTDSNPSQKKQIFICDYCGEKGHKVTSCFKLNPEHRIQYQLKKEAALLHEMNISFNDHHQSNEDNESSKENGQTRSQQPPQHQQMPQSSYPQQQHHPPIYSHNQPPRPYFHHHGGGGGFHHNHHHNNHYGGGDQNQQQQQPRFHQSLAEVTCFKCGEKGHYANRCNKSVYTFLRGGGGGGGMMPNDGSGNGGMM